MDKVHKSAEAKWVVKYYTSPIADTGDYYTQYWLEKEGEKHSIHFNSDDEDDYIEMADKLNAPQSGNVWVKVSEKPLPEKNKHFNGRFNGKPAIVWDSRLIEGYVTVNGNLERTENIEWLDEQPQATTITEGNVEEEEKVWDEEKTISIAEHQLALNEIGRLQERLEDAEKYILDLQNFSPF